MIVPKHNGRWLIVAGLMAAAALLVLLGCQSRPKEAAAIAPARPFQKLSEYGLFAGDPAAQQPAPGVIPYDLNSALFSDYAEKFRFIKLPAGAAQLTSPTGFLIFPLAR